MMRKLQRMLNKTTNAGLVLLFLFVNGCLLAQSAGDYKSTSSGNWNSTSNWQIYNGSSWVGASSTPSGNSANITVNNAMTISADVTAGRVTVSSGSSITVSSGYTFTLDSTVTDNGVITVSSGASFNCRWYVTRGSGSFALSSGGTLYIGNSNGITSVGATGNIQTSIRSFSAGANYIYNGSVAQSTGSGLPTTTITGNITINNSNMAGVRLTNNIIENGTFYVGSGYTVNCGIHTISGAGTFSLDSGSTIIIGSPEGIVAAGTNSGNIQTNTRVFNNAANYNYDGLFAQNAGSGLPSTIAGGLYINNTSSSGLTIHGNYTITSPGVVVVNGALNCGNDTISGTGTFTLASGGTLQTSNADGISSSGATGSIQTSVRNFNTAANYVYNGSSQQITGSGLPATVNNLTINNSAASPSVTLKNSISINGALTLANGIFCLDSNTVTINTGAVISRQAGTINPACSGGSITFTGMVNLTYTGTSNITVGPEMPTSSYGLGILTIDDDSGITLSFGITVNTQLVLTKGSILLNGYTMSYASGATLMYNGTSAAQTVTDVEWPSTFDKDITIANSSGAGVILNATKSSYSGNLTIDSVGVFNVSTYALQGSGTFTQDTGGTFITGWVSGVNSSAGIQLSGGITYSTGGNFVFDGTSAQVTGTDMPNIVNCLTINNSAGVTLSQSTENTAAYSLSPYYSLILTNGAFSIGANTLSIDGVIGVGYGTITGGGSSIIYFNDSNYNATMPGVTGGLSVLGVNRANSMISLGGNVTIFDTLDVLTGSLNIGSNTITLGGTINIGTGTIVGGSASNITVNDNANNLSIPSITNGLNNLVINRTSSGATLAADMIVFDTLALNSGVFYIGSNTLTLYGLISAGGGSIQGGPSSSMVVVGTGPALVLPAIDGGIENLTLNRPNGLVMSDNNDVLGMLTLTKGTFSIGPNQLELDSSLSIGAGNLKGGPTSDLWIGGYVSTFQIPAITNGLQNFSAADVANVQLNADLVVGNSINLYSSSIILGQYNLLLLNANAIYGVTSSNWIVTNTYPGTNGSLVQYADATPVIFPVGSSTSYTPVIIDNSAGTPDSFYANVIDGVYTGGISGSIVPNINNDVNKTWVVSEKNPGYGNATITLQWNTSDENSNFSENNSGISSFVSGAWDPATESSFDNSIPGIVKLSRIGINSFTAFGVGKEFTPLPVSLLYFNGVLENEVVNLSWSTATEINTDYFTLERSADGKNYAELAEVKGAGNSNTIQDYKFTDENPLIGISYYRLKQTDLNGKSNYEKKIVEINNIVDPANFVHLTTQPNPFKSITNVNFNTSDDGMAQVSVSTLTGKTVYSGSVPCQQGNNTISINLDNLDDGMYVLQMKMGNTVNTQKILKSGK